MRLTEVRAKKSINSDELHVREEAVSYFARSFSQDKAVLPLAIGAIEKYGDEEAFQAYTFLQQLAHSPETLGWVSDRLQTIQQPPADEDLYGSLSSGLIRSFINADPALLQPYQDQIDQLGCLDEQARLTVTERLRLASVAPDELWDDLEQFCERHKSDNDLPQADLNHVDRLVEALGRHNDLFADRVLDLLSLAIQDFENNPLVWLELFAVRLAGEMRLEAAVPLLIEKLHADGDWLIEESLWTLIKIGTDSVVTGLGEEYIATDWQFRFSAAGILQDIHSDQAVTTCFQLLAIEDDPELRDHLYRALLLNGATEAFEPVRELLLETDGARDPDWLELRSELVTAATIMDVELPELAEWKEDMQHDMEFRRQWYAERHGRLETPADDDFGSAGFAGEDFDVDEEWTRPTDTLVTSKKVGRNEPCPCGSGKKYKKCCLRKEKGSVLS